MEQVAVGHNEKHIKHLEEKGFNLSKVIRHVKELEEREEMYMTVQMALQSPLNACGPTKADGEATRTDPASVTSSRFD